MMTGILPAEDKILVSFSCQDALGAASKPPTELLLPAAAMWSLTQLFVTKLARCVPFHKSTGATAAPRSRAIPLLDCTAD